MMKLDYFSGLMVVIIVGGSVLVLSKMIQCPQNIFKAPQEYQQTVTVKIQPTDSQVNEKKDVLQDRWDGAMFELMSRNTSCLDLFKSNEGKIDIKDYLPFYYWEHRKNLDENLQKGKGIAEGHSGQLPEETMAYWLVAKQPFVKTICEIEFNAGHSTLVWLAANPEAQVISFDYGHHSYVKPQAEFLQKVFPNRLTLHLGDSTKTVPREAVNYGRSCDIAVIDGGHTYKVAKADLMNMKALSHGGTLVVLDDASFGTSYSDPVMAALGDLKKEKSTDCDSA